MARIMLSFKKSFLEKEGLTKEGMERCLAILSKEFRKAFAPGTIRVWKGKKYIKGADKKWRPYFEKKGSHNKKIATGSKHFVENIEKATFTEEENRALAVLQSIPPITTKPGGWQPIYNTNVGEDSIYFNIGSIDEDSSFKGIIKNNIDCDEKRLLAIIALIVDAITNGKCIKTEEKPSSIPWEKSPSISKRLEKNGVVISTYQQTERYATKVESVDTETNKEAFEKAIKDFEAKIDESEGFEYQSEKGKWSDMLEYIKKVKSTVKTEITKKALEAKDKKLRDSPTAENMIEYLDDAKVKHNPVGEKREKPLKEDEIIDRLANFDGTRGSCVPLAFAYVAQTMGYDVIDFRGGASKKAFARHGIDVMRHFFKNVYQANGIVDPHESALDCLSSVKLGPEERPYLLSAGHHCAIVRKNKDGEVQYLELQGGDEYKGWQNFDKTPKEERGELNKYGFSKDFEEKLVDRFGTKEEKVNRSTLIDFNSGLWPEHTDDFLKIMGYINTKGDKQKVLTREQWEKENSKLH